MVAALDVREGRNAARRVTLDVLRADVQELAVQPLEVLVVAAMHDLKVLLTGRDRPLGQVPGHALDLWQLAVRLHHTFLPLDLVVYAQAVGFVLVVELHVQEVFIVVQLRLGAVALIH